MNSENYFIKISAQSSKKYECGKKRDRRQERGTKEKWEEEISSGAYHRLSVEVVKKKRPDHCKIAVCLELLALENHQGLGAITHISFPITTFLR
jgi:hypothetical protein